MTNVTNKSEFEPSGEAERFGMFPGGEEKFQKFLDQNINKSIVGDTTLEPKRAVYRFTIDTLGHIYNVRVLVSYNATIDNECVRVLSIMPNWSPSYFLRNRKWQIDTLSYTMSFKIPWHSAKF